MPRVVRSSNLETASKRAKLERGRFYWSGIAEGLALGYRRDTSGPGYGTWYTRILTDRERGRYDTKAIGRADDFQAADGTASLDYWQALDRARAPAAAARPVKGGRREALGLASPYTVKQAAEDYLEWFTAHRKGLGTTRSTLNAHVLPKFGARLVAELEAEELARWHRRLATTAARLRTGRFARAHAYRADDLDDPETARRRKASANRVLSVLRAVLNHAWREGRVASDTAWRRLRPFRAAEAPRVRYLEANEARRLVNACAPELRSLVRAGLLTGCRYGELVALRVEDYRADSESVYVRDSKSGRPRHVPLSAEGVALFEELTAGRSAGETLFLHGGRPWGKNHQVRELADACERAKIEPAVSFHVLRHTYGSWLAMRGVALQVIAEALGHADTRITQRHYAHLAPSHVAQVIRKNLPKIAPAPGKVKRLKLRKVG